MRGLRLAGALALPFSMLGCNELSFVNQASFDFGSYPTAHVAALQAPEDRDLDTTPSEPWADFEETLRRTSGFRRLTIAPQAEGAPAVTVWPRVESYSVGVSTSWSSSCECEESTITATLEGSVEVVQASGRIVLVRRFEVEGSTAECGAVLSDCDVDQQSAYNDALEDFLEEVSALFLKDFAI